MFKARDEAQSQPKTDNCFRSLLCLASWHRDHPDQIQPVETPRGLCTKFRTWSLTRRQDLRRSAGRRESLGRADDGEMMPQLAPAASLESQLARLATKLQASIRKGSPPSLPRCALGDNQGLCSSNRRANGRTKPASAVAPEPSVEQEPGRMSKRRLARVIGRLMREERKKNSLRRSRRGNLFPYPDFLSRVGPAGYGSKSVFLPQRATAHAAYNKVLIRLLIGEKERES